MSNNLFLSAKEHYKNAEKMLKKKDLVRFMKNIGSAKALSKDNEDLLTMVTFLEARGLYLFREFDQCLDAIKFALEYNTGKKEIKLKKYRGIVCGYEGYFDRAIDIFNNLVEQADKFDTKVELYINLSWAYLSYYSVEERSDHLKKAKEYLDLCNDRFNELGNYQKKILCLNYGEYYSIIEDYDSAIEMTKKAEKYCEEEELVKVYNNLGELKVEIDGADTVAYLDKAEILASRYNNDLEIGRSFYIRSKIEEKTDQLVRAIDSLYAALTHYIKANAINHAFDCFTRILDMSKKLNDSCTRSIDKTLKEHFKNTPFEKRM